MNKIKCFKCGHIIDSQGMWGLHEECHMRWFGVAAASEFRDLDPKTSTAPLSGNHLTQNKDTFLHGQYYKFSAHLGSTAYILKIQEEAYSELPAGEYLCNQIALLLGIHVPDCYLIDYDYVDGGPAKKTFVTRNFMQDYVGTLHHIYKFLPKGDENYTCEKIIKEITGQTGKLIDISKFIEICLFDALIGNNDRHGRNLGIIETRSIKKLAPMYDNPSYLCIAPDFFLESHLNPSGAIHTKESREPKAKDYISEFERLGYGEIVKKFSKKAISQSEKIMDAIEKAFIGEKRKKAFTRLINTRLQDFQHVK